MLNIVIPMAGAGTRFVQEGYSLPKPLIPLHDMPMIQVVVNNLRPKCLHRFIFICQKKHVEQYQLNSFLQTIAPGSCVMSIEGVTEGAACTVLLAKSYINNHDALMIANCDQYVDLNINDYLCGFANPCLDGLIMTMKASDPKWSFAAVDAEGYVSQVAEKKVISDEATVGIYNFRDGRCFVSAAEEMIHDNERVNGEFYVAPVYNRLIKHGQKIGIYNIGFDGSGMHGLGIPQDLMRFMALPLSKTAVCD